MMALEKRAEKPNRQRTIQSVEVGFRLITCLMENSSALSLKSLAEKADMSPSKAHLYLNSFRNVGLVEQNIHGQYKLGAFALQLGLCAITRLNIIEEAREEMQTLREQTGDSIFISVWNGQGASIIAKEEGHRDTPLVLQIGYLLPLLRSASGRIFLAYLPRSTTDIPLQSALSELRAGGIRHINPDQIIEEVRQHALSRTESQLNLGVAALSSPIFNHDGIAAALTILGPGGLIDVSYSGRYANLLTNSAKRISIKLGYKLAESLSGNI